MLQQLANDVPNGARAIPIEVVTATVTDQRVEVVTALRFARELRHDHIDVRVKTGERVGITNLGTAHGNVALGVTVNFATHVTGARHG